MGTGLHRASEEGEMRRKKANPTLALLIDLDEAKRRIALLEQFVKASDKYMGRHLTHWTVCNKVQIKEAECTCGADELMALREKIGVIE